MTFFAEENTDYPRPQMTRPDWLSLNGDWAFSFDDDDVGARENWQGRLDLGREIKVPFPYQSMASGIHETDIHEVMWYAREFEVPSDWRFERLLLHFCAVDYTTTVWLNGELLGRNEGGHVPFSFDIAGSLVPGPNRISMRVEDRQDPHQPRGKQSSSGKPVRIYYYCTSGIWQTVWLEPLPSTHMESFKTTTIAGGSSVRVEATLAGPVDDLRLELEVFPDLDSEEPICKVSSAVSSATPAVMVNIAQPRPWSPDAPHLYKMRLRLFRGAHLIDAVDSYVGIRSFECSGGRFILNGEAIFLLMVLDQGYWPDSLLASTSRQQLEDDVAMVKRLGFNGVRKHQKIEDQRWLYCCDRLGLLVWEEMPNARSWSPLSEDRLVAEWERAVRRDLNHPSIVTWVPIVESLGFPELSRLCSGQHAFLERIVKCTRAIDDSRPVIDNDGWEHTELTDVCSIHDYTMPIEAFAARYADATATGRPPMKGWYKEKALFLNGGAYAGQPIVLSEVGGYLTVASIAHAAKRDRLFDYYGNINSAEELLARYEELMRVVSGFSFLAGLCYTQLTDIEHETNGLLTYDRTPKVAPEEIARIHQDYFGRK